MFHELLLKAFQESGLTQVEVAARTGLYRQNLAQHLAGVVVPSFTTARKLAAALGTTIDSMSASEAPGHNLSGTFGERLQQALLLRGLSQSEMARRLHIDRKDLRRYLTGVHEP